LSDSFNIFLFELINFIKTNQFNHQSNSEYHNDYTLTSLFNINIIKKISKVTRIFISVSMIINLSQKQVQTINNIIQIAVTATLKKFNSQTEFSDLSELSESEKSQKKNNNVNYNSNSF